MLMEEFDLKKEGYDKLKKQIQERENEADTKVIEIVSGVLSNIKSNGDKALKEYTEKFDKVSLEKLEVTEE